MSFEAFVAPEKGAKLRLQEWEGRDFQPNFVEIEIKYCGLCHTGKISFYSK
jgi:D-arabinose 1-dehydrogenase-like Zn-dependent alcohol dehydrogenase